MAFNPLQEKGVAIEKQIHNWTQVNVSPYQKDEVHPYTRTRIILMNGIEVESTFFSHQMARHTKDPELKRQLALMRRVEQEQQKTINWYPPAEESTLEVTIGYEQVAVDLTAVLAASEPDPYVKAALDFALLEDFDHLYRYANLMETLEGKKAETVVKNLTEITPGRPTIVEHRHPFDDVRRHYDKDRADILTKLHVLTIVSGEQQTMNYYMNVGNRIPDHHGRGLYQEIAQIEEQHVTHYESLADPSESWFERLLLHEYNECYMYYSCIQSEEDERVKKTWQMCLDQEITHLHIAAELFKAHERKDPSAILPASFPELTIFRSNKDYIRQVLSSQVNLTADGVEFVPHDRMGDSSRFAQYQSMVNSGKVVPSRDVIVRHIEKSGQDYRLETNGPNPVPWLRNRNEVTEAYGRTRKIG